MQPHCLQLFWTLCNHQSSWIFPLQEQKQNLAPSPTVVVLPSSCSPEENKPHLLQEKKKVPVFQCKLPPFWLLLLSQLCKSGLWILYNLISTVMPAETCSIGFVFASTVNRCDWSHTGTFPSYYRVILLFSLFGLKQDKTQILQSRTVSRITFLVNLAAYSVQPRE